MLVGTRRRIGLLARVVIASTLLGIVYGSLLNIAAYGTPQFGIAIGAIHGFLISSVIGLLEIFGTRSRVGRVIEQAPFLVTLLVKLINLRIDHRVRQHRRARITPAPRAARDGNVAARLGDLLLGRDRRVHLHASDQPDHRPADPARLGARPLSPTPS
jgi:hypothetical protein